MRLTTRAGLAGAAVLVGVLAAPASAGAATRAFPYTINQHQGAESFTDVGFCDPGPATISLTDINSVLHVSATQAGLTDEQVLALLEEEGSDLITKVTITETGKFTIVEADGTEYTGRFTSWHGGSINPRTAVFTGTFSLTGVSENGDRITASFVGHETVVNGEIVRTFEKGFVKGCPVA